MGAKTWLSPYHGPHLCRSPLHLAVSMSMPLSHIASLLGAGCERNSPDAAGATPKTLAHKALHQATVKQDERERQRCLDVVDLLNCDPKVESLGKAARTGAARTMSFLLMQGADPNEISEGGRPLHVAVECNQVDIVTRLLDDERTEVTGECLDLLHMDAVVETATTLDRVHMGSLLLKREWGEGEAKRAAESDRIKALPSPILSAFLSYHPSTHSLHELAKNSDARGVQALLLHGANSDQPHPELMFTPLIAAVYNKDLASAEVLLRGLSGEARPEDESLLLWMKNTGKLAKANFQGRNDMTALHYAAQQGDPSVVTLLLKHGADRRMRDASNRTAHDMASERSFAAVVKLLENDPTAVSVCAAAATGTWDDAASMFAQGESVNAKHVVVATEGAVGWREQKFFPFVRSQHLVGGVVESKTTRHEIFTPLIAACSHNREDVLEKLLEFEELELDGVNLKGQSALMYAAACGNVGLILKLLRRGSDRTLKDDKDRTAVDWAKVKGMNKAADVCRCDPDAYTLVDCARTNDVGGVGALLLQDVGRNKRDYGEPAIVAAAKAASIGVIEVLAGLGAVPDVEGNALDLEATDDNGESALTAACRLGHEDVVLLLLRLRAKRNPEAIAIAAQKGHVLCAVVTNTDPAVTSLHDACALGKLLQVESLLLQGVEVNELDQRAGRNACTPLMAAAASAGGGRRGKAVMIVVERLLREDGVKVNAKNSQGVTALMIAAGNGAIDLCKILIKHGADKDDKDCKGRGVVWWAYNGVPKGAGYECYDGGLVDKNRHRAGAKNAANMISAGMFVAKGGGGGGGLGEDYKRSLRERRKSTGGTQR